MHARTLLGALLVAIASSTVAAIDAGAHPSPSPHLMRRVASHGSVYPRAPRPAPQIFGGGGGLFGGDTTSAGSTGQSQSGSGTGTGTDKSTAAGSKASSDNASPSSSSNTAQPSSTVASTSTSAAPTSASTSSVFTTPATSTGAAASTATTAPSASTSLVQLTSTIEAAASTSTDAGAAETSAATAAASSSSGSGSSHTGLIVGVSVVGGVALLGALIFLYMKFGGKRFSDFQDDDADIKWPELKHDDNAAAMQPLPARRTGGAGFDMGEESDPGHGGNGDDVHSLQDYGAKNPESLAAATSSTALNAPMHHSPYGYEDGADYASATGYGGVTGYYDAYAPYAHEQNFYPDQQSQQQHYNMGPGAPPSYNGGYGGGEYGQSGDGHYDGGYGSHSTHTSPAMQPYRVAGGGGQQQQQQSMKGSYY